MEWNDGMQNGITVNVSQLQLTRVTDAAQPRLNCISRALILLQKFLSKFGTAHCHASISKHGTSTVASSSSGASYSILAKPDSRMKSKSLTRETIVMELFSWPTMRWQELVLDPQSLCFNLHLCTSILP